MHSHMLLDWRLYASLHAAMLMLYIGAYPLIGGKWFHRYWTGVIIAWCFLGFLNFLDWIWS